MSRGDSGAEVDRSRRAVLMVTASAAVALLGVLATGRLVFGIGVVVSAALASGTMLAASRSGKAALLAGEPARAGMVAGALLALRLVGVTLLMVVAVLAPSVLDMWGVVAGMVAADAALLFSEGVDALTIA
jgi:hypothetical protein